MASSRRSPVPNPAFSQSTESALPLVSVIMPIYNGERHLAETLESVVVQTYPNLEAVLVDDGSTDASLEIAESFARRYPERFRVVRGEPRQGPCRQRNRALDSARGSLICWLDQDDLWMPDKVDHQAQIMIDHPDVGLVYTDYETFDSSTDEPMANSHRFVSDHEDLLAQLFLQGNVVSCTAMFRRDVLTNRGLRLREKDFSTGDDYYLWLLASLDWKARGIPKTLARYRRHDANESDRNWERLNYYLYLVELQREFLKAFPEATNRLGSVVRRAHAKWYELASCLEKSRGQTWHSVRLLLRSLSQAPLQASRARFPRSKIGRLCIGALRGARTRLGSDRAGIPVEGG